MTELSDFYATDPKHDVRPYVLPFGKGYPKWSPFDVDNAAFGKSWLAGDTVLVCKRYDQHRTRPSRVIFTSESIHKLSNRDKIGQRFTARHDQTGARLGEYEIVGLVGYDADGEVEVVVGDVPDVKYSVNTYK